MPTKKNGIIYNSSLKLLQVEKELKIKYEQIATHRKK